MGQIIYLLEVKCWCKKRKKRISKWTEHSKNLRSLVDLSRRQDSSIREKEKEMEKMEESSWKEGQFVTFAKNFVTKRIFRATINSLTRTSFAKSDSLRFNIWFKPGMSNLLLHISLISSASDQKQLMISWRATKDTYLNFLTLTMEEKRAPN